MMEDMTLRPGFTKVGPIFGNQIWGVTPPLPTQDPLATLKKMYLDQAELHARFWMDESLFSQTWLREANWYKGKDRALWEMGLEKGHEAWKIAKVWHKEGKYGFEFSPKFISIIEKSWANSNWDALQAHLHNPKIPFTLCHGDYHAGNMVLAEDEIYLVDWSQCGPWEPTTDLGQTIISDVKPELFLKHSKELLRAYWERLIQLGVSEKEYPFSQCWASFCTGAVERWIWMFCLMASWPAVPPKLTKYFHDQMMAFIEGHGDHEYYVLKTLVTAV